jgi:hypothetical protein
MRISAQFPALPVHLRPAHFTTIVSSPIPLLRKCHYGSITAACCDAAVCVFTIVGLRYLLAPTAN